MDYISFMDEIEGKYDLETIRYGRMSLWPYLRNKYWALYRSKYSGGPAEVAAKLDLVRNISLGFGSLFAPCDYLFFSIVNQRRPVEGKNYDRLVDPIIEILGEDRSLLLELTASTHLNKKSVFTKRISSDVLFRFIGALLVKTRFIGKKDIANADLLETINEKYGIDLDYQRHAKNFLAMYALRKFMLRIYKPKAVFVSYHPSFMAVIKAAHDLSAGIKVVELQHGVIGYTHPAYHTRLCLDRSYYPDYLLSFGNTEKEIFKNSNVFAPERVIPVGSFYIDYMLGRDTKIDEIDRIRNSRCVVAVTGQEVIEHKLLPFLMKAAGISKEIFYIYIPRGHSLEYYQDFLFPDNIKIMTSHNFYEIIKSVDVHATAFSTCALEAPSFDVPNILINIDNMALKYYQNFLPDGEMTTYVETPEEFVKRALEIHSLKSTKIRKIDPYIIKNYSQNLNIFLKNFVLSLKYDC